MIVSLLDGRLEALSILIINVVHIFDPDLDIGNKVNETIQSFQHKCSSYFLETTSKIEIFLVHIIFSDRYIRYSNCSNDSSNDSSRTIEIIFETV